MDWTNPHFAEPQWLLLAILGPLGLLALQAWSARARKRQLALVAAPEFVVELTRSHSPIRRAVKNSFLVIGMAAAGLAMARPQWGQLEDRGQALGQDVIFILDCSRSMLATDVSPNRLERARLAILDFVQQHGQGRVGLVAFAGQAFLQCPLTYDYDAFRDTLEAVDERTIAVPGTDVGRALNEAFRASEIRKGPKIMILLTDGEDLEKGGVRAAEALGKEGAVIFTVGVGTPTGSEIQVRNEQGRMELVRDSQGELVRSRLDEDTLRKVAQAANGAYQPLGSMGEGLARIQASVKSDNLKAAPASARRLGIERFHVPLAVMILLIGAESLLGTRRKYLSPEGAV
jgi:Ca-activated chloride channel homolog